MDSVTSQRQSGFSFLFRTDQGKISRATWWKGMALIVVPLVLMTLGWRALSSSAHRNLSDSAFIDPATMFAYAYLMIYGFAIILGAICFYNLSAKRFCDRLLPRALAGLLPFALLLAGAAHWFQPRSQGDAPAFVPFAFDAVAALIALWCIAELGFRPGREDLPR